ncbi:MAG: glycosyltransferase family 2 protein [Anaerorhabdus sp.]|uniref:glycosyltransferase family 2 protein n=1 Tax=Anaerorhabdus sp. TaxID=1872524 RepID=UPI002FC5A743
MDISIVMTTYNGSKYILEQMESLRTQSMSPSEVIIIDDCSTDATVKIIREYIEKWNLYNWKVFSNEKNVGWIVNFHNACQKATSEFVFFCDQDDIWERDKIQTMIEIMIENPLIDVLACRISLIDENGKKLADTPMTLPFNSYSTGDIKKVLLTKKFIYEISPGCTMVIRSGFISLLQSIEFEQSIPHDALYWKMGVLLGKSYYIDLPLIKYRIHSTNASSPMHGVSNKIKRTEVRLQEALTYKNNIDKFLSLLNKMPQGNEIKSTKTYLEKISEFCDARVTLFKNQHITIEYVLLYRKYYRNFRMLIGDVSCIFLNRK